MSNAAKKGWESKMIDSLVSFANANPGLPSLAIVQQFFPGLESWKETSLARKLERARK